MLRRRPWLGLTAGVITIGIFAARTSDAHFILQSPPSWMSQDSLGLPEKMGPCGDEGGGTATGTVTAFQQGGTVTVTIDEVIFHPGHYRISLAVNDRSELPAEPLVEAGATPCGSVPIEDPPVFPVLADNVFPHTAAFSTPQTTTIVLPANVTCTKCTLQIIEFMSDHPLNNPGGCFYHHCADIAVGTITPTNDGGTTTDASTNDGGVGAEPAEPASSGCGCSVPTTQNATTAGGFFAGLVAFAIFWTRRRRAR